MRRTTTRAFTLIELLVVLGVIALLVGLLTPALLGARRSMFATRSAANVRELMLAIGRYADDNRDYFPRVVEGTYYPTAPGFAINFPFWQVDSTWAVVIHRQLLWWANREIFYAPRALELTELPPGTQITRTSYSYGWGFVSGSELWRENNPDLSAAERGVRTADVLHPSRKCLLWERVVPYMPASYASRKDARHAVGMVDGSVARRKHWDASEPVDNPAHFGEDAVRMRNTRDGVRGIDY